MMDKKFQVHGAVSKHLSDVAGQLEIFAGRFTVTSTGLCSKRWRCNGCGWER